MKMVLHPARACLLCILVFLCGDAASAVGFICPSNMVQGSVRGFYQHGYGSTTATGAAYDWSPNTVTKFVWCVDPADFANCDAQCAGQKFEFNFGMNGDEGVAVLYAEDNHNAYTNFVNQKDVDYSTSTVATRQCAACVDPKRIGSGSWGGASRADAWFTSDFTGSVNSGTKGTTFTQCRWADSLSRCWGHVRNNGCALGRGPSHPDGCSSYQEDCSCLCSNRDLNNACNTKWPDRTTKASLESSSPTLHPTPNPTSAPSSAAPTTSPTTHRCERDHGCDSTAPGHVGCHEVGTDGRFTCACAAGYKCFAGCDEEAGFPTDHSIGSHVCVSRCDGGDAGTSLVTWNDAFNGGEGRCEPASCISQLCAGETRRRLLAASSGEDTFKIKMRDTSTETASSFYGEGDIDMAHLQDQCTRLANVPVGENNYSSFLDVCRRFDAPRLAEEGGNPSPQSASLEQSTPYTADQDGSSSSLLWLHLLRIAGSHLPALAVLRRLAGEGEDSSDAAACTPADDFARLGCLPTTSPTASPTMVPTTPTAAPSQSPTSSIPSAAPTSAFPTTSPSESPTSSIPSAAPTSDSPTASPSESPTSSIPSAAPTTAFPTTLPSESPTSSIPSAAPTSDSPTASPSESPTSSIPSASPTESPTSSVPTGAPTTDVPTGAPTSTVPTTSPTAGPTIHHCRDGGHGCDSTTPGHIGCHDFGDDGRFTCACAAGYKCFAGCDDINGFAPGMTVASHVCVSECNGGDASTSLVRWNDAANGGQGRCEPASCIPPVCEDENRRRLLTTSGSEDGRVLPQQQQQQEEVPRALREKEKGHTDEDKTDRQGETKKKRPASRQGGGRVDMVRLQVQCHRLASRPNSEKEFDAVLNMVCRRLGLLD